MNYSITQPGGRVHFETQGKGEDVLFLHADFVDGRMWDGVRRRLPDYRTASFDKLGYGRSDAAIGPVPRRQELSAVIEALGLQRFHLVGCSNGGCQALDFALENPHRILSLTLINAFPSGWQPEGAPPAAVLSMIEASQRGDGTASEWQLKIWFDGPNRPPVLSDARKRAGEMNSVFVDRGTFFVAGGAPVDPLDPPALGRLSEVTVPTLIVDGRDDWPENRRASRILAEGIPGAKRVEVDGAHVPPLEDAESFVRIWRAFVS